MTIVVETHHLGFGTPEGKPLVQGLSFQVNTGEIVAITGPNGIGKSTLIRVLLNALPASEGQAIVHKQFGYLSQLHNREFHVPLTLADVLSFQIKGQLKLADVLKIGLLETSKLNLAWNTASGGERQKTLLTNVLLTKPSVLILDEPMNHLDATARHQLCEVLTRFVANGEHAVLMVCHEKALAESDWKIAHVLDLGKYRVTP